MNKIIILTSLFCVSVAILSAQISRASKTCSKPVCSLTKKIPSTTPDRFQLVQLPYATNALEPVISRRTIELHHGKHLKAYIDNLNKLIAGTPFAQKDLVTIVKESDGKLFDNAGQTLNHHLYFLQFKPNSGGKPNGTLATAIHNTYGDFEQFRKQFEQAATSLFGSGWVWLSCDQQGKLHITQENNAGNPVTRGLIPLLGLDVWEHAYYLDYENRRPEHIQKIWQIIDWEVINWRYNNRTVPIQL
jgi:Fe-Mn family superoxide dismutase